MDVAELEGLAICCYERLGFDPTEPRHTLTLARKLLGPDAVDRMPRMVAAQGATYVIAGERKIAISRSVPGDRVGHVVGHEIGHILLDDAGYREDDLEECCDYLGGALLAPHPAMLRLHRAYGFDLPTLADEVNATETWAALRLGEVLRVPLAAVSPARVRVRGPESWVWPSEPEIRAMVRRPRPGVRKIGLTDDRRRAVLVAEAG